MSNALPPPSHYRPAPRWGVIIVTGIVAAAVVILGGLLVGRIMGGDDEVATLAPPTPTTVPEAVRAVEVSKEGRWEIHIFVERPTGLREHHQNEGTGYLVVPPQYNLDFGSKMRTEIEFEIHFTLPGENLVEVIEYTTQAAYYTALSQKFYALYSVDDQFLGIQDQAVVASLARQRDVQIEPLPADGD